MAAQFRFPSNPLSALLGARNVLAAPSAAASSGAADNVYVSGLPKEWTEVDLNAVLGTCGSIVSSVILTDKATGRKKGSGLVRFASAAEALYAVQALNGYQVEGTGKALEVRLADRPEEKSAKKAARQTMQQQRFTPYAAPVIPVAPALPAAPASMLMNGIAAALQHIQAPSIAPIPSATFRAPGVSIKIPKRTDIPAEEGANLHVSGLDPNVTDLHLYQAFGAYGAIRSVRVITDPTTKQPKGYGFVQFFSVHDAQTAMAALNGLQVGSKALIVTVHQKKTTSV